MAVLLAGSSCLALALLTLLALRAYGVHDGVLGRRVRHDGMRAGAVGLCVVWYKVRVYDILLYCTLCHSSMPTMRAGKQPLFRYDTVKASKAV